ncbi:hypothetical protein DFJ73DRAFT_808859 [Zopfochytrium polystomum]|nr:hypothetical protein DFJ73DRAFT_808859 [Zopfochytrium polystomum]
MLLMLLLLLLLLVLLVLLLLLWLFLSPFALLSLPAWRFAVSLFVRFFFWKRTINCGRFRSSTRRGFFLCF